MKKSNKPAIPLVIVTRGGLVECFHTGVFCVVDSDGRTIYQKGNQDRPVFLRSCAKPFLAQPLIEENIHVRRGLSSAHLALIAGSHMGEKVHVQLAADLLSQCSLNSSLLKCGIHYPFDTEAANELIQSRLSPSVLHNNCCGKHIGMLLLAQEHDWNLTNYPEPEHPVQKLLRNVLSNTFKVPERHMIVAVDGCGVPTYAVKPSMLAWAFSRIRLTKTGVNPVSPIDVIASAMATNPYMVAGNNMIETVLMERYSDEIILKRGADGLLGIALPKKHLGVAIKIESGSRIACNVVAMDILHQLGVIDDHAFADMSALSNTPIRTWLGDVVGTYKSVIGQML